MAHLKVFNMRCLSPFYVDNPKFPHASRERQIPAPCGKCVSCLKRRAGAWGFRLMQQDKISDTALFVTLTYSNENVRQTPNGFLTVDKVDVQNFMKRLRKRAKKIGIKYYLAAEYGSKSKRPHYHMILFNCPANLVEQSWNLGDVDIGTVTDASVNYSLKYITKGKTVPAHKRDDRQREFQLMSKGLGQNYLSEQMIKYHHADISRAYVTTLDGIKVAMPRYYRDKIFNDNQKAKIAMLQEKLSRTKLTELEQRLTKRGIEPLVFDREVRKYLLTKPQNNENEKL